MQIPQEKKLILEPTIIVITDSVHAKFFYADAEEFRHLKDIKEDMSFKPGVEGHARTAPGVTGAPTDDSDRMHWEGEHRKHLFSAVNDFLKSKIAEKKTYKIILVVPKNLKNELTEKLTIDIHHHVSKIVTKNLTNHPLDKILSALE